MKNREGYTTCPTCQTQRLPANLPCPRCDGGQQCVSCQALARRVNEIESERREMTAVMLDLANTLSADIDVWRNLRTEFREDQRRRDDLIARQVQTIAATARQIVPRVDSLAAQAITRRDTPHPEEPTP